MTEFPEWTKYAVHQRRKATGCIPAGFEMLLRAAGATGIDLDSFQDDFDLEIGTSDAINNFGSVAAAVHAKYPWVRFDERSFDAGLAKIAFIDGMLSQRRPVIISLSLLGVGASEEDWHIYPVVGATDDQYTLFEYMDEHRRADVRQINKAKLARIHDEFPGGKEIAFLAELGKPPDDRKHA